MHKWQLLAAASLLVCAAGASAAPCPGTAGWTFDDVDASDPFCVYATWMADHGITSGCEVVDDGHRNFCPVSAATRLQMAAFMKRFADASAPVKAYGSFSNNSGFIFITDSTGTPILDVGASLAPGDTVQLVIQATLTVVSLQSPAGAELLIERIGP